VAEGTLRIRPVREREVERAVRVWVRSRRDAQPWLEERLGHSDEDDRRFFRGMLLGSCRVFVALEGEEILGVMALREGCVEQLYVDPPAQGRGVGTALLDHAKALSPGGLTLFTHQRNGRARGFYERRGFRAVAFGLSPPPESEPDVRYAWAPPASS
jgi:ribosomal protein S18 acetylase RimI-like enzyme